MGDLNFLKLKYKHHWNVLIKSESNQDISVPILRHNLLWGTVMAEPRAAFLRRERVYIYDDMEEDKHYNRAISFGSLKFD